MFHYKKLTMQKKVILQDVRDKKDIRHTEKEPDDNY